MQPKMQLKVPFTDMQQCMWSALYYYDGYFNQGRSFISKILQSGNLYLVDGGVVHLELVRSARPQYMKVSILKEMTNSDGMPLSILMDQLAMF